MWEEAKRADDAWQLKRSSRQARTLTCIHPHEHEQQSSEEQSYVCYSVIAFAESTLASLRTWKGAPSAEVPLCSPTATL